MEYHRYVKILITSADPVISPELKIRYDISEVHQLKMGEQIPSSSSELYVSSGSFTSLFQGLEKSRVLVLLNESYNHSDSVPLQCEALQIHGINTDPTLINLSAPLVVSAPTFRMHNISLQITPDITLEKFSLPLLHTRGGLVLTNDMTHVQLFHCQFNGNSVKTYLLNINKSVKQLEMTHCQWLNSEFYLEKCNCKLEHNEIANVYAFIRNSQGSMYLNNFYQKLRLDLFNCDTFTLAHNVFDEVFNLFSIIDADHNSRIFFTSNRVTSHPDQANNIINAHRYSKCIVSNCNFELNPMQLFGTVTFGSELDFGYCNFNVPVVEIAHDTATVNTLGENASDAKNSSFYVKQDESGVKSQPIELKLTQRGIIPCAETGVLYI
jgi:hypothetical protein